MQADLERIVKIQGIDIRAAELRKEIAALPKHVAAIERTLESHQRKLQADQALLAANLKERKKIEGDVQVHQQKISKLRDQMSGAKTNEQFRAFQNEIAFCEAEIKKCEDRTIELLEAAEPLDRNMKIADAALKAEKTRVEQEKVAARERAAVDQKKIDELMAERATIAAETGALVLRNYDRLAKRGTAVADATKGRCAACQMEIRPRMMQELRQGDKLMFCESCNRILHYNPPVDVDPQVGGPVGVAVSGTRVDMS